MAIDCLLETVTIAIKRPSQEVLRRVWTRMCKLTPSKLGGVPKILHLAQLSSVSWRLPCTPGCSLSRAHRLAHNGAAEPLDQA